MRRQPVSQRNTFLAAIFSVLASALLAAAQQASGPSVQHIFDEDQKDREINMAQMTPEQRAKWGSEVEGRDAARRKQVLELLSADQLETGEDYQQAAFVFQHGTTSDDFLLAHTLAMVAIAKGSSKSRWIAAASLDRYLQRMKQPQIFGTQYTVGGNAGDKWTQDPYNRALISDKLRQVMCAPLQSEQAEVLEGLNAGKEPSGTGHKKEAGCD